MWLVHFIIMLWHQISIMCHEPMFVVWNKLFISVLNYCCVCYLIRIFEIISPIHYFFSIHDTLVTRFQNTTSQMHQIFPTLWLCFSHRPVMRTVSTIGNTRAFISFTFVASLIPLSFHIPHCSFANCNSYAYLLSHSPSLLINAPRNMKLATTSTIFPSSTTLVILTFGNDNNSCLITPQKTHYFEHLICRPSIAGPIAGRTHKPYAI